MAIEIPDGVELPPSLKFDPNHPDLIAVQAGVGMMDVPWYWDEFELKVAADRCLEKGLELAAAVLQNANVYRNPEYSRGWQRPSGRHTYWHFYEKSPATDNYKSLCGSHGFSAFSDWGFREPAESNVVVKCRECEATLSARAVAKELAPQMAERSTPDT